MSMWLNLAKVSPDLLAEIRARPDLFDRLFFEDESGLPDGVTARTDILGCDYLTINALAESLARESGVDPEWRTGLPWLARAVGDDPPHAIDEYEFCYGSGFYVEPGEVAAIRDGLISEGWPTPDDLADDDADEDDDAVEEAEDAYEYDDFVHLIPFFDAAAREGKAIVGGVS
jgi:hypothetical protein